MNAITTTNHSATIAKMLQSDPQLRSKHTTRQYKSDLTTFEAWCNGRPLTKTLVEEYAAQLQQEGKAPNTINQKLAALRWFARKMADRAIDEMGDREAAEQALRVAAVKDVKGERPERGRHIQQGELSALMDACIADLSPAGVRDAAIIALAWATGLRREEIAGIKIADLVNKTKDSLDIGIIGKGEKPRTVYVNDGALSALLDWMDVRGNEPGMLFVNVTKGKSGKLIFTSKVHTVKKGKGIKLGKTLKTGGGMTGEALRKMLDKRSEQAELSQPITWHDFRRTFAGNLWGAGIDGVTIQKLMGHASQNQTAKYDRRPEDARRQAVKVLHVPYKKK